MRTVQADRWVAVVAAAAWPVILLMALLTDVVRDRWWIPVLLSIVVACLMAALPVPATRPPSRDSQALPCNGSDPTVPSIATIRAEGLSIPKAGNGDSENEDAFSIDPDSGRVAVADGASSSFRARDWGRHLCSDFVSASAWTSRSAFYAWSADVVDSYARTADASSSDFGEFWAQEAARRGSHAAFLGVGFYRHSDGYGFRALAVGDTTLIHLRGSIDPTVVSSFPIIAPEGFSNTPDLLSSAHAAPTVRFSDADILPDDHLLAMTDETAKWALMCAARNSPIWALLLHGSAEEFAAAVDDARAVDDIVNDDMTVVRITIATDP